MTVFVEWKPSTYEINRIRGLIDDALLEQRIREVGIEWIEATRQRAPVGVRRRLAERHRALVGQRSPEQIERLERAKGLR